MARAVKKQRNKDSSKFQDAVDASAANDGTGVVHEDGVPKVIVELTDEQRDVVADESARLVLERAELDKARLDKAREFRKALKVLNDRILELAGERNSRKRMVPAQQDLPMPAPDARQTAQAGAGGPEA